MQITVFGASGNVGQVVVQKLLNNNHTVVAFVHSSSPFTDNEKLKVVKGDIHNAASVTAALQGSDAVISTLGSWHTPTKDILSSAMQSIIPAMQAANITRIISLTGSGANAPGDVPTTAGKIAHKVFSLIAPKIINDAEEHLRLLHASDLEWTVLRASIIKAGDNDGYVLNFALPPAWEIITRASVANALVHQLDSHDYLRRAPHVHPS